MHFRFFANLLAVFFISFALSEPGQTIVKIYNVLGQTVTTLADGFMNAGYYSFIWDGKDTSGGPVSSGIYFYTIHSGNHFQVKKMTLLR
jgi:flagellar hook assembly protein FlgD